jgi:hypothetical protein
MSIFMTPTKNNPPQAKDRPIAVRFQDDMIIVTLQDGREIATPLHWYPTLEKATPEQRNRYTLSIGGIHWDELDEDLSILGILAGNRPRTAKLISLETN